MGVIILCKKCDQNYSEEEFSSCPNCSGEELIICEGCGAEAGVNQ